MNSNLNTDEKAKKITALAHAIMVLLSAILYSITSDKFCAAVTCSLIIALQFFTKQRIEYTDRSIIYTSIFAFIYSYATDLLSPFDKNFYIIIGDIFSTSVSAPFLLYIAAATALFKYNEYAFGVSAAFCMMSILLTSDINPNASGIKISTYYSVYFLMIALITSTMIFGIQTLKNIFLKRPKNARSAIKKALLFLAIFTSLAFSGLSIFAIRKFENSIRLLDIFITKYALLHLQKGRHIAFGKDVNLNKIIDPYVRRNSAKIVLRAVASSPPEYLRGRAYDKYMNGRWTDSNNLATIKMRLARQENILAFNRFLDDDSPENVSSMSETRIFPEKILLSEVLVAPPSCAALDIFANAIGRSPNGNLYPEEWDRGTAFTAYGIQNSEQTAFRAPSPPLDKRLLEVPANLTNEIDLLLNEALGDEKKGIPKTDREVVRILEKYFLENFKYEIVEDTGNCPIKDPISSFFNRRTGHCELFATAMTLALRRYGIPSRYVTGFVCNEYNPQGKYYVSRLGDAHAWCEAYLRDEEKWILAEPTPPSAIPIFKHEWGAFEKLFDAFKTIVMKMFDDVKKGYFAKAIIDFVVSVFNLLKTYFLNPLFLFVLLICALMLLYYLRHSRKKKESRTEIEGIRLEVSVEMTHIIKKLSVKIDIPKKRGQTALEWIESAAAAQPNIAKDLQELADIYQVIRFSPEIPEKNYLTKFKQITSRLI